MRGAFNAHDPGSRYQDPNCRGRELVKAFERTDTVSANTDLPTYLIPPNTRTLLGLSETEEYGAIYSDALDRQPYP